MPVLKLNTNTFRLFLTDIPTPYRIVFGCDNGTIMVNMKST